MSAGGINLPYLRNLCKTRHCEKRSDEAIFKYLKFNIKIASLQPMRSLRINSGLGTVNITQGSRGSVDFHQPRSTIHDYGVRLDALDRSIGE
jgi:hypothetical protein